MDTVRPRRIWITGGSGGLGTALAQALLEQGCEVALGVRRAEDASSLHARFGQQLLVVAGNLASPLTARQVCARLYEHWQALDGLIINAGTCDYLDLPLSEAFIEQIPRTNLAAATHCLEAATPLLRAGCAPHVTGILNRFSSLQLHDPEHPARPANHLAQVFDDARHVLHEQGIALTVVAPQTAQHPLSAPLATPQPWTAQQAAQAILQRLAQRPPVLVLEALSADTLWPLPT
ncbi:SDR family NAD(P)-dependent oxidoreductase [Pseudomonas aegrilactucae]|uniref:SDR family NAD(P)-dependent oxidoreductase n=1 Tax=Pseudomonas aegrilactucae TaxID=2854028 RepID=A0A9Q3ADA7_9PSED|nr:SDR family NAD(P)-dependent oxidoreductase [Pseudomonas aegrilactucae]MBV6287520.1 SDR family NAD(P)-dependent oxidoreductase [Pseudomonas aegrilactucae]